MILSFYLKYSSRFGQSLFVSGNTKVLGNDDISHAAPLQYLNKDYWYGSFEIEEDATKEMLSYKYVLRDTNGEETIECCDDKVVELLHTKAEEILFKDSWNTTGDKGNVFYTQPFQQILLPSVRNTVSTKAKKYTHDLRIKGKRSGVYSRFRLHIK